MAVARLIKQIISTDNARVVEYLMPARTRGSNHYHSRVFEELFCLSGVLRIQVDGREDASLSGGDKVLIEAGVRHRVNNDSEEDARFLVVQGGGKFDILDAGC